MTESLEKPPEEGSPRDRFRSDARAEARWRRHEIQGRISAIKNNMRHLEEQVEKLMKIAMKSVTKDRVFDIKEAPKMLAESKRTVDPHGAPVGTTVSTLKKPKRKRKDKEKPDG